jgi:hypothetical protein
MVAQPHISHPPETDATAVSRQQWKWSTLAGMASYLDAGSIVALGAGLALFQNYLHLSTGAIGALAAIGPNAIGCAIGAFGGGWLGDKLGRKRIYQYDLLVYAAGILSIALAVESSAAVSDSSSCPTPRANRWSKSKPSARAHEASSGRLERRTPKLRLGYRSFTRSAKSARYFAPMTPSTVFTLG